MASEEKKAIAFAAVPDIIKNGAIIDRQENWKGRGYGSVTFAAPVEIAGEGYVEVVIAKELLDPKNGTHRFYLHEVGLQKSLLSEEFKTGMFTGSKQGDVAKLLKEIVSAKENVGKVEEEEVLYRDPDEEIAGKAIARDMYERMMSSSVFQFTEAVQDSMLGLRAAYDSILKAEGGRNVRIEDVAGYENAYLAENRMHSASQAQISLWRGTYMKPLLSEIVLLTGNKRKERRRLADYMMAKHGLERNEVMAERDARKKTDRIVSTLRKRLESDDSLRKRPNLRKRLESEKLTDEERADITATIAAEEVSGHKKRFEKNRGRDYSGLTALTGESDVSTAEAEARQMVDDYEREHDTTALWNKVNAATKSSLHKSYLSGSLEGRFQPSFFS